MKLTVIHMSRTILDGILFALPAGESLNISYCIIHERCTEAHKCHPLFQFFLILKLKFQFWNSTNCILPFYGALQFYHYMVLFNSTTHSVSTCAIFTHLPLTYARGTAPGPLASRHFSMRLLHQWSVCNQM